MTTTTLHLEIAEFTDDMGVFCSIWPAGNEPGGATYPNLGAAAWAIASAEAKDGECATEMTVYGTAEETARFNRALGDARRYYQRLERESRAPRDKRTGRGRCGPQCRASRESSRRPESGLALV